MVVMFYLALLGIAFLWLMTRSPLWQMVRISIDHGLEAGARNPSDLG